MYRAPRVAARHSVASSRRGVADSSAMTHLPEHVKDLVSSSAVVAQVRRAVLALDASDKDFAVVVVAPGGPATLVGALVPLVDVGVAHVAVAAVARVKTVAILASGLLSIALEAPLALGQTWVLYMGPDRQNTVMPVTWATDRGGSA